MLVNLTEVFTTEGKMEEKQVSYEKDEFVSQLGTFHIQEKQPISLILTNIGNNAALVKGNCKLIFAMQCDRCLKDVAYTFDISFSHEVTPNEESEQSEDAEGFMEGYHLNVETLIDDEILLNWPTKILCRDDCKGICKMCGKDLNIEPCGCDDFVPDPRMAAIKDIFNQNLQ